MHDNCHGSECESAGITARHPDCRHYRPGLPGRYTGASILTVRGMRAMRKFRFVVLVVQVVAGLVLGFGGASLTYSAVINRSSSPPPARVTTDPILTAWIINTDGHTNPHWATSPVNVQSATQVTINGAPYVRVQTNRIPDYYTTMTSQLIQELNGRPHASTDFRLGHSTATEGQVVRFGDDIGYSTTRCVLGYWPPGPSCPTAASTTTNFPMQPIMATTTTSTTLGATGLWVDGSAVYNWSDGMSYNNGNVWQNAAMSFEQYDM